MEPTVNEIIDELKKIAPDKLDIAYLAVYNRNLKRKIQDLESQIEQMTVSE